MTSDIRKIVFGDGAFHLLREKMLARRPNFGQQKRAGVLAEHRSTRAEQRLPDQSEGQTKAAGPRAFLFHRGRDLELIGELRLRMPHETRKDRGGAATDISSKTYSPLRIFLNRATRSKSASLSASARASLRPAEVSR